METLFIYFIKSSGLIGMFYLAYYFLLRKETFFNSNRWFLLAGLITSALLPLVVFTKIVWVDPIPTHFDWSKIPVTTPVENEGFEINWHLVFVLVYSIGILAFLMKLAFDFYSLSQVLKGKTIQQLADFKFIDVTENVSPFSYFNSIVYNSSLYSEAELENILEHEKVHSAQNHTVDVLVSRLFCVVFWFNPFIWLYKKAILQNLEFIADSEASKKLSDKKAYQMTLLKITTQENCVVLTNHFYQSLIKKRIIMLNKNQSNKRNSWKYAAVLPLLGAFLFFFQVEVVAQEKEAPKQENETKNNAVDPASSKIEKDLNTLSKGKTIYINGEKSSENKLAILDPNEIEKAVKITEKEIYINGAKSNQTEVEKLDPEEIERIDVTKNSDKNEIRITTKKNSDNTSEEEYLINGDASFKTTDPNTINRIDVNTNNGKQTIRIVKSSSLNFQHDKNAPVPPTPPTPPVLKIKTPPFPNIPKAPKAPKGNPVNGDKKAWQEYEKKMEEFDKKMKAMEPQMMAFEKKMEEFDKQMEPFNAEMEAFEKKMKIYEQQMKEYHSKTSPQKAK